MFADEQRRHVVVAQADDTAPVVYSNLVYQAFARAENVRGSIERCLSIGGLTVRLRFAGPALVQYVMPAFSHLVAESSDAHALRICVWDSVSTHSPMPPHPWNADAYIARGDIQGFNNDRIQTAFQSGADALSIMDRHRQRAVFWVHDASQFPYYERGFPLRTILHWWLRENGHQLVHAAAVGDASGGVILAGKGGVGKSTTSLACLNSHLKYAGDDYVLLSTAPQPFVYSLYNSAKLNADNLYRFPELISEITNRDRPDTEKALMFLNDHFLEKISRGFPLRAILLPNVTAQKETRLRKISGASSLRVLASSTMSQLPGADAKTFQTLSEIVKQVPSYRLDVGSDISQIPTVIARLLSELAST